MFNLEQSIADWRKEMLAAGIKSPVPLEELENHLREEIEQQVKAGVSEQQAFEGSASQVGQAEVLKKEFIRAKGLRDLLGDDQTTRTHRVLGMIWLGFFLLGSLGVLNSFFALIKDIERFSFAQFCVIFLLGYIFMRGITGSISLFRGKDQQGRRIIRTFAFLCVILVVVRLAVFKSVSMSGDVFTFFSLATIWLLRPPQKSKLATR
jgi:uncharacterized membrane protein